ncbi:MAG: LysM peptidoglycan-binding domain-containing protein [Anaerolineae bacterium]|nr:LysM peptidoglycan-binding domain-containing protein [Anaerolineae bacterium]
MQRYRSQLLLAVSCLGILLLATACFQTAGESLNATSVAQDFSTLTPSPTLETQAGAETPEVTEALLPELPLDITEEPGFETIPDTPTPDQNFSVPQQDTIDDSAMTATAIIVTATARAEQALTATAQAELGQGGGVIPPDNFASPTPFVQPPAFATATPAVPVYQPTVPANYVPGQDCIHEVRIGDNLFRISLYYGISIEQIAAYNGISNIQLIIVGQKLVIPGCGTTGNPPPPTSVPGTYPPYPGNPYPPSGRVHVVRQYESLFRISMQYGVPIHTIAAANGIYNINLIYIGQQLIIP